MNQSTQPIQSTSLHFREGSSDKVYHAAIEPKDNGFIVTFAYGRRGSTLTTGTKTNGPVPLEQAQAIHRKLVGSKLAKGYKPDGGTDVESGIPYQQNGNEGRDSGIRCQLLNPVDESELAHLLNDKRHCLQEKYDGRRLMILKQGDEITGINRRGLVVAIPDSIRKDVTGLHTNAFLIDGEAVGDTLHVFDLLELNGADLRAQRYADRYATMLQVIPFDRWALRRVDSSFRPEDKKQAYELLRQSSREGVVFKDLNAPFNPGRPASGGTQLKYKFVESASFVVISRNEKRSVSLGLYDGDTLVPAGNVTIPPNHAVPMPGEVVETKYLYAHKQSGAIYQPVYLGKRCDIPAAECGVDQLKYKPEAAA